MAQVISAVPVTAASDRRISDTDLLSESLNELLQQPMPVVAEDDYEDLMSIPINDQLKGSLRAQPAPPPLAQKAFYTQDNSSADSGKWEVLQYGDTHARPHAAPSEPPPLKKARSAAALHGSLSKRNATASSGQLRQPTNYRNVSSPAATASPSVSSTPTRTQAPRTAHQTASAKAASRTGTSLKPARSASRLNAARTPTSKTKAYPETPEQKTPPWSVPTPKLYRNKETGEITLSGSHDELILPVVAKRLIAERLQSMGRERDDLLIAIYDKEGLPQAASEMAGAFSYEGLDADSVPDRGEDDTPASHATATPAGPVPDPSEASKELQNLQELHTQAFDSMPAQTHASYESEAEAPREVSYRVSLLHEKNASAEKPQISHAVASKRADADSHGGGCCSCAIM